MPEDAPRRQYGPRRYSACFEHGGFALSHLSGHLVEIRRVTGVHGPEGLPTHSCHCGNPADFYVMEVVS